MPPIERLVLYEKFNQDRMNSVFQLAAQVMSEVDAKQAGDFLQKFMDGTFPEAARSKEDSLKSRMKELNEFATKEVSLVPGKGGLSLSVKDKEK